MSQQTLFDVDSDTPDLAARAYSPTSQSVLWYRPETGTYEGSVMAANEARQLAAENPNTKPEEIIGNVLRDPIWLRPEAVERTDKPGGE